MFGVILKKYEYIFKDYCIISSIRHIKNSHLFVKKENFNFWTIKVSSVDEFFVCFAANV